MKLPLAYYGNPLLRKKCLPIKEITQEICRLADDMIETMDQSNGIGLAASQVGHLIRLFVLRKYHHLPSGEWTVSVPIVYINPKILEHSKETWSTEEGCLSIPKVYLPVDRPLKIKVEAQDREGNTFIEELEGMNARVVLHENDHLNGVLFIDRVDKELVESAMHQLRAIKKTYLHPQQ